MSSERAPGTAPGISPAGLLADFSLEMTGKDIAHLDQARASIPPGTRINVTFLAGEDLQARVAAAKAVRDYGLVPVPHISARRIGSEQALTEFLTALRAVGASERLFVISGDPPRPEGPYEDAAALVRSGQLEAFGARRVSIAGYPEGHPEITDDVLWTSLTGKARLLAARGLADSIITQFGFDADAVLRWIERVRDQGIGLPVRVGVPGPAGVRRLLRYAARFGVGTSAGIARKYGLSLTSLMSTAGPDAFIRDLVTGYDRGRHGEIRLHFYTFGGLAATSEWISEFRQDLGGK